MMFAQQRHRNTYRWRRVCLPTIFAVLSVSCFTGVESTPRITASDVRRNTVAPGAEDTFLDDVKPQPPAQWSRGKRFAVVDNRVSLIFNHPVIGSADNLVGHDLVLEALAPAVSLTGDDAVDITFSSSRGDTLVYTVAGADMTSLAARAYLLVPFTVERSVVEAADSAMRGRKLYIRTPRWLDKAGNVRDGLRHVPVTITDVVPGNSVYSLRVGFKADGDTTTYAVYMNVGSGINATRDFASVFAFDNPRLKYPNITDDTWELIKRSRVREGMSPIECRLALGAPAQIERRHTNAGMIERWSYDNGVFLLFENEYLIRFRL